MENIRLVIICVICFLFVVSMIISFLDFNKTNKEKKTVVNKKDTITTSYILLDLLTTIYVGLVFLSCIFFFALYLADKITLINFITSSIDSLFVSIILKLISTILINNNPKINS